MAAKVSRSPECITPSAFDHKSRRQSAKVGIFNLISTMIGGGALSLPFAVSRCGLILGFSLLIISAILSVFSFDILIATSRRTGAMTYQQIGYFAFGQKVSLFVTILILFNCYIASIAYCVLIGDLIKPVICYIFSIDQSTETLRRIIIASCILCVSPFCYMRQIGALKYTSLVSIVSVSILTAIITMHTLQHFNESHLIYYIDNDGNSQSYQMSTEINLWPTKWDDVVYVFPVFGISFLCHFNIPQVHSELTRPTRKRMRKVLIAVVISCFLLYSVISVFGYFYSFKYTCGNILLNYRQDDPIVTFGRMCLGFVILFTFPLLILPARTSLHNIINQLCCSCDKMNLQNKKLPNDTNNNNNEQKHNDHIILQHEQPNLSQNSQIQKVKTTKEEALNYSMDGAAMNDSMQYSLISDIGNNDENKLQPIANNRNRFNFTSRSFSNTDSPLRKATDALGVINEPKDIVLLQDSAFLKSFRNLESSVNYKPSTIWLIVETTLMILSSVTISFLTESVMVLWGLMGSTVGFTISFILPSLFYVRIRKHKGCTIRNVTAFLIAIFFSIAIVLCTWQSLVRLNATQCPIQPPN